MMNTEDLQKSLPSDLQQAVSGYVWKQNKIGCSSSKVFRLQAKGKNSLYLKIDSKTAQSALFREKQKLEWLGGRIPVPKVLLFAKNETHEYLLLSEIAGVDASDESLKKDILGTIEQLISGLKMIHRLPIENCPFKVRLSDKIEAAREQMMKGLIDAEDFDDERLGMRAEDLFEQMIANKPFDEDSVFTHGDYCLPNVILKNGKLSGFVDLAAAGVADRYQDLALLSRSVGHNFGKQWEAKVFEIYGIEPDWKKIHFYRLLDEFF